MYTLAQIALGLLCVFSAFEGLTAYSHATSAFHQIYAVVWIVVLAVSLGAIGIISAVRQPSAPSRSTPTSNATPNTTP